MHIYICVFERVQHGENVIPFSFFRPYSNFTLTTFIWIHLYTQVQLNLNLLMWDFLFSCDITNKYIRWNIWKYSLQQPMSAWKHIIYNETKEIGAEYSTIGYKEFDVSTFTIQNIALHIQEYNLCFTPKLASSITGIIYPGIPPTSTFSSSHIIILNFSHKAPVHV